MDVFGRSEGVIVAAVFYFLGALIPSSELYVADSDDRRNADDVCKQRRSIRRRSDAGGSRLSRSSARSADHRRRHFDPRFPRPPDLDHLVALAHHDLARSVDRRGVQERRRDRVSSGVRGLWRRDPDLFARLGGHLVVGVANDPRSAKDGRRSSRSLFSESRPVSTGQPFLSTRRCDKSRREGSSRSLFKRCAQVLSLSNRIDGQQAFG